MGNQTTCCIKQSLGDKSTKASMVETMDNERDSVIKARKDIRKKKLETIESQQIIQSHAESPTGDSTPQNERQNSENSSQRGKKKKIAKSPNQHIKKQYKEDQIGYETPIKISHNEQMIINGSEIESFQIKPQTYQSQELQLNNEEEEEIERRKSSREKGGSDLFALPSELSQKEKSEIIVEEMNQDDVLELQRQKEALDNQRQQKIQQQIEADQQLIYQQEQQEIPIIKKKKGDIRPNKILLDNPNLKKINKQLEKEQETLVIPIENQDSAAEFDDLISIAEDDPCLPDKIIQKAYSIGGIRKYNYIFKTKRRDELGQTLIFQDEYLVTCAQYLTNVQCILQRNLEQIRVKLGLDIEEFQDHLQKADIQNSSLEGLGRRMEMPVLDVIVAQDLHQKIKSRVMDLWKGNQQRFQRKNYDMDIVLQALQCYAEDMLYFESGLEIEQLHRVVISDFHNPSSGDEDPDQRDSKMREKEEKDRLSIFTIEERDNESEEQSFKITDKQKMFQ